MAVLIQTVDGVTTNRFPIDESGLTIGRASDCQIISDDSAVSAKHAIIRVYHGPGQNQQTCMIEDLGSTNGTWVNDKKIEKLTLREGDTIRIGWNVFHFSENDDEDLKKTQEIKKSWIPGVYYTVDE